MYKKEDIRNFYFENEKGQRIDCQKIDGNLFFFNVAGLGYEAEIEYSQIGDNFIKNKEGMVQNVITGDLEFYNMTYDEYEIFINFILQSNELKLVYIPKKSVRKEYYRDIDIVKIDKNEEDDYNILTCPITMNCKSLWYQNKETVYTIANITEEMQWNFIWETRFTDYSSRLITFNNDGHVEAPFKLEMNNYIINPSFSISQNGNIIHKLEMPIIIQKGEKFLYSSKDNELYIMKQNADGSTENLFKNDYIDLNKDNIFKIPKGVSEIMLYADNDILDAKLSILKQYKGV